MTRNHEESELANDKAIEHGEPCLFVHITKTAGISFRDSLDESQHVIYDYGIEGPKTSEIIRATMYRQYDPYTLLSAINGSATWLVGHFRLIKHCDFVDCRRIVTFVRNPLERAISHFNHTRSYVDDTMDLEKYLDHPEHRNVQSRYLHGLQNECIGFVGVTEKIDESYELINSGLSLRLQVKHSNNNQSKTLEYDALPAELEVRFRENNKLDYALYDWALGNHNERVKFLQEGKPWCHGYYTIRENKVLYGVAFFAATEEAVQVNVFKNGVHLETLTANSFHADQIKAVFPRKRYVAFRLPDTSSENDYEVFVAATGQKLNFRDNSLFTDP